VFNESFDCGIVSPFNATTGARVMVVLEVFKSDRYAYDAPLGLCRFPVARLIDNATSDFWVPFDMSFPSTSGTVLSESAAVSPRASESTLGAVRVSGRAQEADEGDDRGKGPPASLLDAVRAGDAAGVQRCLRDHRCDVNAADEMGYTAAHEAASAANAILLPVLRSERVRVDARNRDGNTPFHYFCAKFAHPDCAAAFSLFARRGVDLDARNNAGETPLHKAVLNGHVRVMLVKMLLHRRVRVSELNFHGETPLHYAVHLQRSDVILLLVKAGADLSVRGKGGLTPHGLAAKAGESAAHIAHLLYAVRETYSWLDSLGLGEYKAAFAQQEVWMDAIPSLSERALDALGVRAVGHRLRLLSEARRLQDAAVAGHPAVSRRFVGAQSETAMRLEREMTELSMRGGGGETPLAPGSTWMIKEGDVEFTGVVGEGTRGTVYKGIYAGRDVAIKVLADEIRSLVVTGSPVSPRLAHQRQEVEEEFKKEFAVLSSVRSPYTVRFFGASLEPRLLLILDFCHRGSLFHVLNRTQPDHGESIGWPSFFSFATDMVRGVDVLHSWVPAIVHRDIKSHNVLCDGKRRLKLGDFGLSRFSTQTNLMSLQRTRGTLAYVAPEMMDAQPFSPPADIYSTGVVLWEIMARVVGGEYDRPYAEFPNLTIDFQILVQASQGLRPTIPASVPQGIADLISSCWNPDPAVRPSSTEMLVKLDGLRKEWLAHAEEEEWTVGVADVEPFNEKDGTPVVLERTGAEEISTRPLSQLDEERLSGHSNSVSRGRSDEAIGLRTTSSELSELSESTTGVPTTPHAGVAILRSTSGGRPRSSSDVPTSHPRGTSLGGSGRAAAVGRYTRQSAGDERADELPPPPPRSAREASRDRRDRERDRDRDRDRDRTDVGEDQAAIFITDFDIFAGRSPRIPRSFSTHRSGSASARGGSTNPANLAGPTTPHRRSRSRTPRTPRRNSLSGASVEATGAAAGLTSRAAAEREAERRRRHAARSASGTPRAPRGHSNSGTPRRERHAPRLSVELDHASSDMPPPPPPPDLDEDMPAPPVVPELPETITESESTGASEVDPPLPAIPYGRSPRPRTLSKTQVMRDIRDSPDWKPPPPPGRPQ
jgi:serine/threonine protein kinase